MLRNSILRPRFIACPLLALIPASTCHAQDLTDPAIQSSIKLLCFFIPLLLASLAALIWMLQRRLRKNVADLQQTKVELQHQVERFQLAMEAAQSGLWEHFPAESREERSKEWFSMLGYAPQLEAQNMEFWANLIHPEDREPTLAAFNTYLRNGGHGTYEARYRMQAQDGSWRWILGKGRTVDRDDAGHPRRIVGINLDIQQLQTAREEAQRSQTISNALLEQTSQFFGLISPAGILIALNRAACQWAGVRPEDVQGRPIWDGPWWPDQTAAKSLLSDTIQTALSNEICYTEICLKNQENEHIPFGLTASPFREENGLISAIIFEARDIREQKKAQQNVLKSERRFRSVFEHAPYPTVITRLSDGMYLDANKAALNSLHRSREEVVGKTVAELDALPLDEFSKITEAVQTSQNSYITELSLPGQGEAARHILYAGTCIEMDEQPCLLSMIADFTDLKNAQDALRKSQELFARLFELSPDMIVLIRQRDRNLLEANQAFTRFTGYSREEALHRAAFEVGILTIPQQFEAFSNVLNRDGLVENFESDLRHRDGRILKCSTSAKMLDIDGERCILSFTRDVTQLQALHEIVIQSEKMLSLGGIAAGIAHEINNPLGIVLQGAQTVALRLQTDFPKNQEAAEKIGLPIDLLDSYLKARKIDMFLQDIQSAAIRAASIIRHMLDFSRRSESRRTVCDIAAIMEKALTLASCDLDLKKKHNFKYIEITRDFDEDLRRIQCTETEIEQVFLNLLRNAAQAMSDATPPVSKPSLRITLRNTDDGVRIEIADNGPGIPDNIRRRIFEPFFTTKEPGTGTGLGLSVSYFIVTKSHDGQMHVLNPAEGGTTFVIELPSEPMDSGTTSLVWTKNND